MAVAQQYDFTYWMSGTSHRPPPGLNARSPMTTQSGVREATKNRSATFGFGRGPS